MDLISWCPNSIDAFFPCSETGKLMLKIVQPLGCLIIQFLKIWTAVSLETADSERRGFVRLWRHTEWLRLRLGDDGRSSTKTPYLPNRADCLYGKWRTFCSDRKNLNQIVREILPQTDRLLKAEAGRQKQVC